MSLLVIPVLFIHFDDQMRNKSPLMLRVVLMFTGLDHHRYSVIHPRITIHRKTEDQEAGWDRQMVCKNPQRFKNHRGQYKS